MITIEINEETATAEDMAYALEHIANLIRTGVTRGYGPDFNINGYEEPEVNE